MADKVIVGNDGALQAKYGPALSAIRAALTALIASDTKRGLKTSYVALDDPGTMARYGATAAVIGDEASHKTAFDAVWRVEKPSYALLLGAPDIIPHISLKNPMYNPTSPADDPDMVVPSDIPYACDAPYSSEPFDFVGATRVVTRLPDISGQNSAHPLIDVLTHAQHAGPVSRQSYTSYLGATAAVWHQSTMLSLSAIFGSSAALQDVPPASYQWTQGDIGSLSHFFNCHGADQDTRYYGQSGNQYPPAHDASYISGKLSAGVILVAECCYGAQLFNPTATAGQPGIANVYMGEGAHAVWGSTTIAYGPSDSNGQADLICQYFLDEILSGSSVGMAGLRARQRFSSQSTTLSPSDLKTLAQYIALGDASVQPVTSVTSTTQKTTPKVAAFLGQDVARASRIQRRATAQEDGSIENLFRRRTAAESIAVDSNLELSILGFAQKYGIVAPSITTKRVVEPQGPKLILGEAGEAGSDEAPQRYHLVFEHVPTKDRFSPRRILEIGEANGRILTVSEIFTK